MKSFRFLVVLLLLLGFRFINGCAGQTVPYFRILAPQFLCSAAKNGTDFQPPKSITVALQTRGSQRLTYNVQVYFQLLDGFKNQRHTLSVWRSIRMLEKKLRNERDAISLKNQIDVRNDELIPGVEYTFSIVGVDDEGNTSPAQNFTITYRGSDSLGFAQDSSSSGADISFLLIGTWSIYRDLPFLMQGVVIFCDPDPFYEFHWMMSGTDAESSQYLAGHSKTLLIPGGLFRAGSNHDVSVNVRSNTSGRVIAQGHGTLTVLARDFQIQLVPNNQSVGVNRKLTYTVFVDTVDVGQDNISIAWRCLSEIEVPVECEMKNTGEFSTSVSFPGSGLYQLTVSVSVNGITKNDSAFIHVDPEIITSVDILSFDPFEVVAGEPFNAVVRINYLIPQCTAYWYSVANDNRFQYLNASGLEKGFGTMDLHDLEESFLSELVEFANDTSSYDLKLTVPGSSTDFNGFAGNAMYLFRLIITCPGLFDEVDDGNVTNRPDVTSYSELILRSNEPPSREQLDVSPKKGVAMKTMFKFSTAPAIDSPSDYPMRYKFYYQVDKFWVMIGDFFEHTVTSVELPYLKVPIKTMYIVCDSRKACSQVNGPNVQVTMDSPLSDSEFQAKLRAIEGSMLRRDYSELFERLVCLIWTVYTYEEQYNDNFHESPQYEAVNKFNHELLDKELPHVLKMYNSTNEYTKYVAKRTLQEWFVITSKVVNAYLKDIIKDVLVGSV